MRDWENIKSSEKGERDILDRFDIYDDDRSKPIGHQKGDNIEINDRGTVEVNGILERSAEID